VLAVFSGGLLGTVLIGFLLGALNVAYARAEGPWIWLLCPHRLVWLMIAAPIAFSLAGLAYNRILGRLKGPPPPGLSVEHIIHTMPLPKFINDGALLVAALFTIVGFANVPHHVRISANSLCISGPGRWTEEYVALTSLRSVALSRYYIPPSKYGRGGPSAERGLFITRTDGTTWTPVRSSLNVNAKTSAEIGTFLAEHSRLPLEFSDGVIGLPTEAERGIADVRMLVAYSVLLLLLWLGSRLLLRFRSRTQPSL
jgi:hypothetical protein